MSSSATLIEPRRLESICVTALRRAGAAAAEAQIVATSLIDASLRGVNSHGVELLPFYLPRIEAGGWVSPSPAKVLRERGSIALIDAGNGLGAVSALKAIDLATRIAGREGIGLVSVRNSGHFGAAGYFARPALRAGMIGIVATNASPAIAPTGGRERLLSNNPWAIAVPTDDSCDLVLDLANSVVARGRIRQAALEGREIPPSWAQDTNGRETTDPATALLGALLPMAGHKGYGIALMVDILAGVLSASRSGPDVGAPFDVDHADGGNDATKYEAQGVGHLFVAIDVAAFRPLAEFKAEVSALLGRLRASQPRDDVDRVRVPGEIECETAKRHAECGIPVSAETLAEIKRWCAGEPSN